MITAMIVSAIATAVALGLVIWGKTHPARLAPKDERVEIDLIREQIADERDQRK